MEREIVVSGNSKYITCSEIHNLENRIILIYDKDVIIGSVIWEYETEKWILSTKKLQFEDTDLENLVKGYPNYIFKLIE